MLLNVDLTKTVQYHNRILLKKYLINMSTILLQNEAVGIY